MKLSGGGQLQIFPILVNSLHPSLQEFGVLRALGYNFMVEFLPVLNQAGHPDQPR
jgi:hypothetical protein